VNGYGPAPATFGDLVISAVMTFSLIGFIIACGMYVIWLVAMWLEKRRNRKR